MPVLLPGLTVSEITETAPVSQAGKIDNILMICTRSAAGTGANLTPLVISSAANLVSIIGTVNAQVAGSFDAIRTIAPNAIIWVLSVTSATVTAAILVSAINAVPSFRQLPFLVAFVPEIGLLTVQGDRSSVNNAGETVFGANGWDYLYLGNMATDTDTKAKADTEAALLTSSQGNSATFYGYFKDSASRELPLSVAAAGWLVANNQNFSGVQSFAYGVIPGTVDPKYVLSLSDANDVMGVGVTSGVGRGYNFVWFDQNNRPILFNDATRASDSGWNWVVSRLGLSILQNRLAPALAGLQFKPADISADKEGYGRVSREAIGITTGIAQTAQDEGIIAAFTIAMRPFAAGMIRPILRVKPLKSVRFVEFQIVNTENP